MTTLGGRMPGPIASAATGPFEVTGEHVTVLTERMFPQLLRRLLSAEAQTFGLPEAGIHVANTIHAADGGEDGRIEWEGGPERTLFLPSRRCRFQLKAGRVELAKAGREVLARTGGTVKAMVRSVLEGGRPLHHALRSSIRPEWNRESGEPHSRGPAHRRPGNRRRAGRLSRRRPDCRVGQSPPLGRRVAEGADPARHPRPLPFLEPLDRASRARSLALGRR